MDKNNQTDSCCGFCFGVGLSSCCRLSGCWSSEPGKTPEQKEAETIILAIATLPVGSLNT